jgi:hypothetical protein
MQALTSRYGASVSLSNPDPAIDFAARRAGNVLGPVPLEHAARRLRAYCTEPDSGWSTYDLAGLIARASGAFDQVSSWSLFYANALNGQVTLANVAAFDRALRRDFASRLAAVPHDIDLHEMNDAQIATVVHACAFGFSGVWGPKITKLGALYRPRAIPVLDGHVAEAFGFHREAFSAAVPKDPDGRRKRIDSVVRALASGVKSHQAVLRELRRCLAPALPELSEVPDLRLIDMVIWTSQDDRMPRRIKQGPRWVDREPKAHIAKEDLGPEPV